MTPVLSTYDINTYTDLRPNGIIYEQLDGAAVGSPVSAVISNLYSEEAEIVVTDNYLHVKECNRFY